MTAMGVPHHRSACRVSFVGFGELLPGICAKARGVTGRSVGRRHQPFEGGRSRPPGRAGLTSHGPPAARKTVRVPLIDEMSLPKM
jgi:hypothetical protein